MILRFHITMMKTFIIILLLFLNINSAPGQISSKGQIKILDLAEAFSRPENVSLSRFVEEITFIPLETTPEAMISGSAVFEVTDDFVIAKTSSSGKNHILLFDRITGRFIREIGKQGRGPGEFLMWSQIPFNQAKKELYAHSYSKELLTYDLAGNYIGNFKLPQWKDPLMKNDPVGISYQNMLDDNTFVGYVLNLSGSEKRKLILLKTEGVVKVFPNHLTYNGSIARRVLQYNSLFCKWDNKLFFIEGFCDTLYQVKNDLLEPRLFFDWGKYNATYSEQNAIDRSDYFILKDIDENKNYIFFRCWFLKADYTGFIDKKDYRVTFCKNGESGISSLKENIAGLMDVVPNDFTRKNEMIYILEAVKLMAWLKENPEKAKQAKSRMPWLKDINEFSNPVVAIGKCKE